MRISHFYMTFGNTNNNKPSTVTAKDKSFYLGNEGKKHSLNQTALLEQSIKTAQNSPIGKGIALIEELHEQGLYSAESHMLLSKLRSEAGDYDGAVNAGIEAWKINPSPAELYFLMGNGYKGLKDGLSAINEYSIALDKNPKYLEAIIARGETYLTHQVFSAAIGDFSRAITLLEDKTKTKIKSNDGKSVRELKNQVNELYFKRGIAKVKSGHIKSGLLDFSRVSQSDPNNFKALDYCIELNQDLNNFSQVSSLAANAKTRCEKLRQEAERARNPEQKNYYNSLVAKYLEIQKKAEKAILQKREGQKHPDSYYKLKF